MITRLAGFCLMALLLPLVSQAQEITQPSSEPKVLPVAPDESPVPPPMPAQAFEEVTSRGAHPEFSPLREISLRDRVLLPDIIRESRIYPKLEAELQAQRNQDAGFHSDEPPANWNAIGNPFATIGTPLEPLTHRPLYFEDPEAERYGRVHSDCVQPFVSAGRFYLGVPLMSVKKLTSPPHQMETSDWPDIVDPAFEYDQ